jgi:hypothetical protein
MAAADAADAAVVVRSRLDTLLNVIGLSRRAHRGRDQHPRSASLRLG